MSRLLTPLLILTTLATTACGRIALPATSPPPVAALRAGLAQDLPGAVAAARAAIKDPAAKPMLIAAYGVTATGRLANSTRAGWVIGLMHSKGDGTKASTVALFWDGDTRVMAAKPPEGAQGAALMPDVLPPMKQALTWAQAGGLPKAATYQLAYIADPDGPAVAVTERTPLGGDPLADRTQDDDRKVVIMDCSTGKPILPPAPAPAVEEAEPDSAEGASALAALAFGVRYAALMGDAFPLEVRLFALIREKVGREVIAVDVPTGTTVKGLAALLRAAEPAVAPYLEASRVAVNLAFAPADQVLAAGDAVALIPPVGGG